MSTNRLQKILEVYQTLVGRPCIESHIELGQLLTDQKKEIGHGRWTAWMEETTPAARVIYVGSGGPVTLVA